MKTFARPSARAHEGIPAKGCEERMTGSDLMSASTLMGVLLFLGVHYAAGFAIGLWG